MSPAACSSYSSATRTSKTSSPFSASRSYRTRTVSWFTALAASSSFSANRCSLRRSFTGQPGRFVPVAETVRGFREILDGQHDHLPEQAFRMVGTIDEALEKGRELGSDEE